MDLGKVLIIEDDPDVATVLAVYLRRLGAQVQIAPDGTRGAALARSQRWDLMLVDLLLPGKDGYDVVCDLKRDNGLPDTVVVFVTSASRALTNDLVSRSGADGLISKPFTLGGLKTRLELIMSNHRQP